MKGSTLAQNLLLLLQRHRQVYHRSLSPQLHQPLQATLPHHSLLAAHQPTTPSNPPQQLLQQAEDYSVAWATPSKLASSHSSNSLAGRCLAVDSSNSRLQRQVPVEVCLGVWEGTTLSSLLLELREGLQAVCSEEEEGCLATSRPQRQLRVRAQLVRVFSAVHRRSLAGNSSNNNNNSSLKQVKRHHYLANPLNNSNNLLNPPRCLAHSSNNRSSSSSKAVCLVDKQHLRNPTCSVGNNSNKPNLRIRV
jgi:hypothetical protein